MRSYPPGTTQFESQLWSRIVCSPIPDDEIDPDRLARVQLYWTDPDGFADAVNPPCRPDRVADLVTELAQLVPNGYARPSDEPVPQPAPTKYPDELETYFTAIDHHGLTGQTHLFPAAGPIDRDTAATIRAALTNRERTNVWRQIWSNNPTERLNREIRRRTDVVGIFPNRDAIVRLIGAVLAEQTDEWAEGCRYLGLEVLSRCRLTLTTNPHTSSQAEATADPLMQLPA